MNMENYNVSSVENFWSKIDCSASDKNFYAFSPIRARSSKLIFGESDASDPDWCEKWTVEKYLKDKIPFGKCLSICCGFGAVERILSGLNVAKEIIGTDIAPGAIKAAKERAIKEGYRNISYFIADLNTESLPENEYDIIWANGAIHHIKELDTVIPKLYKSLKNGGILIANEYVGPNYQQLDLRHQEIINAVKHLLPDELANKKVFATNNSIWSRLLSRTTKSLNKKAYKTKNNIFGKIWEMMSIEEFLKQDPSESVNASNIIPTLAKHFNNMEVKYFDGSVLYYALDEHFYNNFDSNNPKHRTILEMLFKIEDDLIASGEIGRHNAHIICKKD
jgi:ubiquinone/menaquinone biosynthesis C-methylase UbiE